jgi:hypothetical protein
MVAWLVEGRFGPCPVPGGKALPFAPDPLSARTLRALDPGSWHSRQSPAQGPILWHGRIRRCRGRRKTSCPRGWRGPSPESIALRRDPAAAGASEREVQDPQGPGGWGCGGKAEPSPGRPSPPNALASRTQPGLRPLRNSCFPRFGWQGVACWCVGGRVGAGLPAGGRASSGGRSPGPRPEEPGVAAFSGRGRHPCRPRPPAASWDGPAA